MKKLSIVSLVCASALGVMAGPALSHGVQTDYLLSPKDGLALDVTFSTGEPMAEAPVKIYSPDNLDTPWFEGKTDEDGKFNFQPDKSMEGEWTVEIGELSHADILSVPVQSGGIQLDNISRDLSDAQVAQAPFSIQALPAQAASSNEQGSSLPELDLILLGTAVLGGLIMGRRLIARKP
ncbi:MAG: hypothetical protein AAGB01_04940 [Cyanobacteria bacterium P01_F01_bin.42]